MHHRQPATVQNQHNNATEKDAIEAGTRATEIWPGQPVKAAQKDIDACWTQNPPEVGRSGRSGGGRDRHRKLPYTSRVTMRRRERFIRHGKVTDSVLLDGRTLHR